MRRLLLGFPLLLLPLTAQAQNFDCAAIDAPPIATTVAPRDRLNALEQNGCLGGRNDHDTPTHELVNSLPDGRKLHSPGVSDEERRAATLATRWLSCHIRWQPSRRCRRLFGFDRRRLPRTRQRTMC